MKPLLLWTDLLLWFLVAAFVLLFWWGRSQETLRRPWRRVVQSQIAMGSLALLLPFLAIALLDSLHFRLEGRVVSLFDLLTEPLWSRPEKSYSAPLATHLYIKEFIPLPGGQKVWDYPRLRYGGAHLQDPSQKWPDILITALSGGAKGGALWLAVTGLVWLKLRRPPRFAWQAPFLVLLLVAILGGAGWALSQKYHLLGTDKVGEDVLYQSLKAIRTGLIIGTLTTLITLPFALIFGMVAGYFGGWLDDLIQYLYTTLSAIPSVLLIAAAILIMQVTMARFEERFADMALRADFRLLFLCAILGVTSWTGLCRLLRAETLKLREMEFVQAAKILGLSEPMILMRHILPNLLHIVLIVVVLDFSGLVLAEAVLSYIQIGVDPTTYSWGNMINRARLELARDPPVWWTLTAAFLFMSLLVLAANLFADVVREAFNPRSER